MNSLPAINHQDIEILPSEYDVNAAIRDGFNFSKDIQYLNEELSYQIKTLDKNGSRLNRANSKYIDAEETRQAIIEYEHRKYDLLYSHQENLLNIINYPSIKLWRYGENLYFRSSYEKLFVGTHEKIKNELSSRYGVIVHFVNDINDVLQNNNEIRVDTTFIAINSLPVIEEEVFNPNERREIYE